MELAIRALSSLLPKLGTLLSDEYKLQKGVRGEIRFLQAEMESMQAVLNKVSKLPAHQIDDLVKIWARDLKELSYDIEDSVDAFKVNLESSVCAKQHSVTRFFDTSIKLFSKSKIRHRIATDMEDTKSRIHEMANRRERYKFDDFGAQTDRPLDPRLPDLSEDTEKLVGIDVPAERILNMLTQGKADAEKQMLMVVSVVGVGGLGKTTIANLVYDRLGGEFECRAFVSVSLKPNMKQILSSVLRQISEDTCSNCGEKDPQELIRSIRQFLKNKRYIVVIDDVWDTNSWEIIRRALIDNKLGSKVIVTTRNAEVAILSSADGSMYELDPLSYEDSRRLLCRRIFNGQERIHSELVEVSMKILKKCGGIPLAIVTVASLLASISNKTKSEWYGVYNSMGSGLEKDKTMESMREILSLSYNDLPLYLKPCLLYLSMFPENSEIPSDMLIRMWVAEGFIDEKHGTNQYELGGRYFSELVNRSMIHAIRMDVSGTASIFRVHGMILDLIISIAARENFITISDGSKLVSPVHKIRRLSLQDSKEEQIIPPTMRNISHVRSLIGLGDSFQQMPSLSSFAVLRVLTLEKIPSNNNLPKEIGSLRHLRYLKLGGELKKDLLTEIGNLKLLKTLDLWATSIQELPACIVRLQHLEHLLIDIDVKLPDGAWNLRSLQELSWLNVCKSPNALAELGNLTELRVLSINGLAENEDYMKAFLQNLSNLRNIRTLLLGGNELCSIDCISDRWRSPAHLQSFNGRNLTIFQLPRWFSSLYELSYLSVKVKMLGQDDIKLLGALPVLRFLELHVSENGSTEECLIISKGHPFPSLTYFKFEHHSRCWLLFDQGVMLKVQRLELYFEVQKWGGCFDIGLENLTSLKHVNVIVDCYDADIRQVEDVEIRISVAMANHPNNPTLELSKEYQLTMASQEQSEIE